MPKTDYCSNKVISRVTGKDRPRYEPSVVLEYVARNNKLQERRLYEHKGHS